MTENEISYQIRGTIFDVYNEFGPGLLENLYEKALILKLQDRGLKVQTQVPISVELDGKEIKAYRLDLLVENKVIVELKSTKQLLSLDYKQTLTYLRTAKLKLGLLVNFNTNNISTSIKRVVNGL